MKISITARHVKIDARLREKIERRCAFAFSRTKHIIDSIVITLADVNGPKGGEDKLCKVVVRSNELPPVIIKDNQSSLHIAAESALTRAGRRVQQAIARKNDRLTKHVNLRSLETSLDIS